ncbi:hypothetical protein F5Y13DRAFT_193713 [Hypoxylon sp. FL1857]|nr:hypothetical protein F5Y13DRAFT_193713 [Hypoxylon sp. FL1857]
MSTPYQDEASSQRLEVFRSMSTAQQTALLRRITYSIAGANGYTPIDGNSCVMLRGLSTHITSKDILAKIRGIGRVYDIWTLPPRESRETTAACVAFFEQTAAVQLRNLCRSCRFKVGGHVPHAGYRVLLIVGYEEVVNTKYLNDYFSQIFEDVPGTEVIDHKPVIGFEGRPIGRLEYQFASYPKQAFWAHWCLVRDVRHDKMLTCEFGPDPCA